MQVRTMVGRLAGEIVEMPYHVATAMLANGTAISVDAPYKSRRATQAAQITDAEKLTTVASVEPGNEAPKPNAPPVATNAPLPADWRAMHHKTRVRLARERGYQGPDNATDADAFLADFKG
jgi:hypothetical protein